MSDPGKQDRPDEPERPAAGRTEGDVVTPAGDRRSAGISRERERPDTNRARRDPRPAFGERSDRAAVRPEDLETHEEAEARRAAGGAPYEREAHPGEDEFHADDGPPTPKGSSQPKGRPEGRSGH